MIDNFIKDSLKRYVERGIEPGGFLTAVLENDLMGAMGRADAINRANLHNICRYVYNELPSHIWGSREIVQNHTSQKQAK